MAWRNAPAVAAALAEATRRWPKRSRVFDGTIGDAAHAARKSDHNPDSRGVVHAFDLTHDPAQGVDCEQLAAHLVRVQSRRVQYIIWNKRICSSSNWVWRPYSGANPHTKHMHVSIQYTTQAENDTSAWWDLAQTPGPSPTPTTNAPPYPGTPLRQGSRGTDVRTVQQRLKDRGSNIAVDGIFGPKTHQVVVAFQMQKKLAHDGIVGPKTWAGLWQA